MAPPSRKSVFQRLGARPRTVRISRPKMATKLKTRRTPRSGFGSIVARGARTLISLIPGVGAYLAPLADFAFKTIGISSTLTTGTSIKDATISVVGLGGELLLPMSSFICDSTAVVNSSDHGIGNDGSFLSRFSTARLISITVKLLPGSQLESRQGEWAMSFTPFLSPSDEEQFKPAKSIPNYGNVCSRPGAKRGPATRVLSITYRVPITNAYLQMNHDWETKIGVVSIAYQDTLRDNAIEFRAAEVAPEVVLSGVLAMGTPVISGYGTYSGKVTDMLGALAMTVHGGKNLLNFESNGFSCKQSPDGKSCLVSGKVSEYRPSSLRDMLGSPGISLEDLELA